jgi:hypothetical protein
VPVYLLTPALPSVCENPWFSHTEGLGYRLEDDPERGRCGTRPFRWFHHPRTRHQLGQRNQRSRVNQSSNFWTALMLQALRNHCLSMPTNNQEITFISQSPIKLGLMMA